ncbi:hypothetical protein N431DRAFT_476023 [Stipitochalara longipes BDJ]|nr:hypothetical protein N431DRAFT_476023 [Stipitochalara longipes BDJ]
MASPATSPARSPASTFRSPRFRSPLPPEAPKESAVSRLLIAPLTFVSFLLSLALIDSRNHSLRTHSHSPSRPAPTTLFGHVKAFIHSVIWKPAPGSPYSYIKSPNSKLTNGREKEGKGGVKGKEDEPWHWHTKQRHMMKAEMDDAFRVRKWVVVFLLAAGVMAFFGALGFVRWVKYVWKNWDMIEKPGRL